MTETAIRRAAPGDGPALSLVGAATFLETFAGLVDGADIIAHCARQHAADLYETWLADPAHAIFLAEIAPRLRDAAAAAQARPAPIGFCILCPADVPIPDPRVDDLEIKRIYLLSRFHGTGLGRALMDAALTEARARNAGRVLIGVKDDNHRAIAFYRKHGFEVAGTRRFTVGAGTYSDLIFARAP